MIPIKVTEFLTAAVNYKGYPEPGPPEVAFAGKSNVGKSSLINSLIRRKKLVRVSSRPGRTQQINFFSVNNDEFRMVDLPGYGFAKVPMAVKKTWQKMIEDYLSTREPLMSVVVILDIRRDPGKEDLMLLDYLKAIGMHTIIVATKADKLSNNKRNARLAKLKPVLQTYDPGFLAVSAPKGMGREALWNRLFLAMGLMEPEPAG